MSFWFVRVACRPGLQRRARILRKIAGAILVDIVSVVASCLLCLLSRRVCFVFCRVVFVLSRRVCFVASCLLCRVLFDLPSLACFAASCLLSRVVFALSRGAVCRVVPFVAFCFLFGGVCFVAACLLCCVVFDCACA